MSITVQLNHYDLRILINGVIHLYLLREEFIGFTSWADDDKMYVIAFHTKTNTITTQYDEKAKWLKILNGLSNIL